MCELLYVAQLRCVQLLNFILSDTKFDDIYYKTIFFKELRKKILKMPARATPHDKKFSIKPQQQFTIKSIVKQQATSFNQLKTNQNHSTKIGVNLGKVG